MQHDLETPMTYRDVCKLIAVSRDTLDRMIAEGDWPAPMLMGKQLRWLPSVVKRYMAASSLVQAVKKQATKLPQVAANLGNFAANEGDGGKVSGKRTAGS